MMKERSFMFRRRRIWFYPYLRMNVSHLKPKTIIKGFLYSRPMVEGKSYFIDFGLFKISIGAKQMTYKEWLNESAERYHKYVDLLEGCDKRPKDDVGNFNYREE